MFDGQKRVISALKSNANQEHTMSETTVSGTAPQTLTAFEPRLSYVAFHVADIERALRFYTHVLGLKEQLRLPLGEGLQEVVLGFPHSQSAGVILMWNDAQKAKRQIGDGYSRFVLNVTDVDAALAHLVAHDTPVVTPAKVIGAMKYALVRDPDGYVIELLQFLKA